MSVMIFILPPQCGILRYHEFGVDETFPASMLSFE